MNEEKTGPGYQATAGSIGYWPVQWLLLAGSLAQALVFWLLIIHPTRSVLQTLSTEHTHTLTPTRGQAAHPHPHSRIYALTLQRNG